VYLKLSLRTEKIPAAVKTGYPLARRQGKDDWYGMDDIGGGGFSGHDFFSRRLLRKITGAAW
jgi:hypothetical protein